MIYPDAFLFFQNFDFLGCQGVKGKKNGRKWQKFISVSLRISGTIPHMILDFGKHGS